MITFRIQNRAGSVEHYYHFILGFLLPLTLRLKSAPLSAPARVRSCGPMDRILTEVFGTDITAGHKEATPAASGGRPESAAPPPGETLQGFDLPEAYDARSILTGRDAVLERLGLQIGPACAGLPPEPHIVLIQRLPSPEFYLSAQAEIPTSGAERRSVPNMQELLARLSGEFASVSLVALEYMSLRAQAMLFGCADIIIAQHGAALTNLLWCRPGTRVIEIMPRETLHQIERSRRDYFGSLARLSGLRHTRLLQDGRRARVDPDQLLSAIGRFTGEASEITPHAHMTGTARRAPGQDRNQIPEP